MSSRRGRSREPLATRLVAWLAETPATQRAINELPNGICLGTSLGRRDVNEDEVTFCSYVGPDLSKHFKAGILCDGIGGLREGAAAARVATASFIAQLVASGLRDAPAALRSAILVASQAVYEDLRGAGGCTLTCILVTSDAVTVGNVGDSRAYAIAESGFRQLTVDDTLAAYANDAGKKGGQLPDLQGLVQYVGMSSDLDPTIHRLEISHCDLMLASDGAYFVGEQNLQGLRVNASNARNFVQRLLQLADWLGGSDNASVALIPLAELSRRAASQPAGSLCVWTARSSLEIWPRNWERSRQEISAIDDAVFLAQRPKQTRSPQKKDRRKEGEHTALREAPEVVIKFEAQSPSAGQATTEFSGGISLAPPPAERKRQPRKRSRKENKKSSAQPLQGKLID